MANALSMVKQQPLHLRVLSQPLQQLNARLYLVCIFSIVCAAV